jgi:hypothetical protein
VVYYPEYRVQGSGSRVLGSGSRVQGSGSRVQGPGSRVQGQRVQGPGSVPTIQAQGTLYIVQGLGSEGLSGLPDRSGHGSLRCASS